MKRLFYILLLMSVIAVSSCGNSGKSNSSSAAVTATGSSVSTASEAETTAKKTEKQTAASTKKKKTETTTTVVSTTQTSAVTEEEKQTPKDWELEAAKAVHDRFFQYLGWGNTRDAKLIAVGTILEKINTKGTDFLAGAEISPEYYDDCVMNFKDSANEKILQLRFYINGNEKSRGLCCYSNMYYINGRWLVENFDYLTDENSEKDVSSDASSKSEKQESAVKDNG